MPDHNFTCDLAALDLFLCDKLAEGERQALENHLGECTACRRHLEQLAAEPTDWIFAHEALSSADDVADPDHPPARGDLSAASPHADGDVARAEHIVGFLSATDDPRMLGRFGGYEIAGVIGCGGMGVVLKAHDVALNRYVAIKVLAPHLATSAAARLRFAREAQAAAAVVHENVIAIHAVSEANGLPYLVMPYVRGTSLQKRLDAQGPLRATEILRIGMQAAAGLAAAHAQGLVHRDIKPANILLEDGVERLTITDFGLARAADDASLTRSGVIAGTPQFMSPEQARGEAVDARSDLFSLGSVLYALCTGRPPFRAETSYGVLRRISDDLPRPIGEINPQIPDWLAAAIGKLHAKARSDRFESAEAVARLFEQCLAHVQQPAAVGLPRVLCRPAPKWRMEKRGAAWWMAGTLATALASVALVLVLWGPPQNDDAARNDASAREATTRRADSANPALRATASLWNDGAAQQILDVEKGLKALESDAKDFWTKQRLPAE